MDILDIFLSALNNRIGNGIHIYKYTITPTIVNCIEKHNIEIWFVNDGSKTPVSIVVNSYNTSELSKEEIYKDLCIKSIESTLKYYGI